MNVYTRSSSFPTKRSLKDAIATGYDVYVYSESMFHANVPPGEHVLVGPGPDTRTWYARVIIDDASRITRVVQ